MTPFCERRPCEGSGRRKRVNICKHRCSVAGGAVQELQFASHLPSTDLSASMIICWQRGIAWILERLDLFRPADPTSPDQLKEIAELSLLYGHVLPWVAEEYQGKLAPIGQFLCEFLGKDLTLAHWVRRAPSQYNPYIVAYLPLRSIGVRLPAFEEAVSALHSAGYPEALENTPYREMELQYLTWKAGVGRSRPNWGRLYQSTGTRGGGNPICFSIHDFFFFQAEDGIRDYKVTGVQTCALPDFSKAFLTAATLLGRPTLTGEAI